MIRSTIRWALTLPTVAALALGPAAESQAFFGLFRRQQACTPACVAQPQCAPQVVNYVPQTCYRTQYVSVPVTTYRPVSSFDACTGCPVSCMKPVTTYVTQTRMVPYTTYNLQYSAPCNSCAPAPTATYYAPRPTYYSPTGNYANLPAFPRANVTPGVIAPTMMAPTTGYAPTTTMLPATSVPSLTTTPGCTNCTANVPQSTTTYAPVTPSYTTTPGATYAPSIPSGSETYPGATYPATPPAATTYSGSTSPSTPSPAPATPAPTTANPGPMSEPSNPAPLKTFENGGAMKPIQDPMNIQANPASGPGLIDPRARTTSMPMVRPWSYNTVAWPAQPTVQTPSVQEPISKLVPVTLPVEQFQPAQPIQQPVDSGWRASRR